MYGLLDVIGEIKRNVFYLIMNENYALAYTRYTIMQSIYDALVQFRFSNTLLRDFRRKQDIARIQIEQTSSEIVRLKIEGKI